jgi:UDPglucose 6-dehydrogenase
MDEAKNEFPPKYFTSENLTLTEHQYDAVKDVDAMLLVTEWKQFRQPDFEAMKQFMKRSIIFDGRNQYDLENMKNLEFEYSGIGRVFS